MWFPMSPLSPPVLAWSPALGTNTTIFLLCFWLGELRGHATMVTWHLPAELHFEVPQVGTLRTPWEELLISKMVPKILSPLL